MTNKQIKNKTVEANLVKISNLVLEYTKIGIFNLDLDCTKYKNWYDTHQALILLGYKIKKVQKCQYQMTWK